MTAKLFNLFREVKGIQETNNGWTDGDLRDIVSGLQHAPTTPMNLFLPCGMALSGDLFYTGASTDSWTPACLEKGKRSCISAVDKPPRVPDTDEITVIGKMPQGVVVLRHTEGRYNRADFWHDIQRYGWNIVTYGNSGWGDPTHYGIVDRSMSGKYVCA